MGKFTSIFRTLAIIYRESKIRLICSVILLIIISFFPLLQVHITNVLIRNVSKPNIDLLNVTRGVFFYGIVILLCNSRTLVNLLGSYLWITAEISLQNAIINEAGKKNLIFYDTPASFQKLEKANEGYGYAVGNTMMFISTLFITAISLFSMTAYLVSLNGIVVLTLLLVIPIKIMASNKVTTNIQRLRDNQAENKIKVQKFASYISCRDSKVHRATKFFFNKWYTIFTELLNQNTNIAQKNLFISLCSDFICYLVYGFVMICSVINSATAVEAVGDAVVLFVAIEAVFGGMNSIINQMSNIMKNTTLSLDLFDFLNDKSNEPVSKQICDGSFLEMQDVSFSYPNRKEKVLEKINLKIKEGENIAIVGKNGAGKSTLVKLLAGLYTPNDGKVLFGTEFNLSRQKYDNISIMPQEVMLYNLSLKDNIKISKIEFDKDVKAEEILINVLGEEKINMLDNGSDTLVGKEFGGIDLSGGEKQRISYGRTIYRENTLLFLDEPTSAIDPLREKQIYKEFLDLSKGTTTIFVTHRLASVKYADRIIVIDGGKIVESGTHKELLAAKGIYSEMYNLQKDSF